MASSVLLISTLALLAAANAELCNTKTMGDTTATPYPLREISLPGGSYNIHLPDVCRNLGRNYEQVGSEVSACSYQGSPLVTLLSLNTANIYSNDGARVSSLIYCSNMGRPTQGRAGSGIGRQRTISAQPAW